MIYQATANLKVLKSKTLVNGKHSVVIRVYSKVLKKNKDYSTGESVTDTGQFTSTSLKLLERANDVILKLNVNNVPFTFEMFESHFLDRVLGQSLIKFIDSEVAEMNKLNKSSRTQVDLKRRLVEFTGGKDILFHDITFTFIQKFKAHLAGTNSINSIRIYFRTLKALWNKAQKHGLISKILENPLRGEKLQSTPTFKRYLMKSELDAIMVFDKEIPRSYYEDARRMFYFSYQCYGMNPTDMFRLKWSNISNGVITYSRRKTGDQFRIKINTKIQEILDYYKATNVNSAFVFPVLKDGMEETEIKKEVANWGRNIAKNIRRIAEACDIPNFKEIDAYTSRHTFACHYLKLEPNASIYDLMKYMGHSSESATRFYISSLKIDLERELTWI